MRRLPRPGRLARVGLLAGLLIVPGSLPGAQTGASDCGVLERMAGKWFGGGSVRRYPVSGAEPLRCRLASDWDGARGELASRLDCRGIDGDVTMVGSVAASGSEGRLEGNLESAQGLEDGVVTGWCEPDAIRLELAGWNSKAQARVEAKLVISLSDGDSRLTDTMEARDPDSGEWFQALEVEFER